MKNKIRNNKCKNEILKSLNDFKFYSIYEISNSKSLDIDLCFVCSEELERNDLVVSKNTMTKEGVNYDLRITRKGSLFKKDGGYPSSGIRIITKAIIDNKTTIISIIALIISILSYYKD